jgi:hypothetical protein
VQALYLGHLLAEDAGLMVEGSGFSGINISFNARLEQEVEEVIKTAEIAGG